MEQHHVPKTSDSIPKQTHQRQNEFEQELTTHLDKFALNLTGNPYGLQLRLLPSKVKWTGEVKSLYGFYNIDIGLFGISEPFLINHIAFIRIPTELQKVSGRQKVNFGTYVG